MEANSKISFEDTEVAFAYKSDAELKRANFIFSLVNHPWISALATFFVKVGLALRLPIDGIIKKTVFNHFCAGESINKAEETIRVLSEFHVRAILDYSVEGEDSENGFDDTALETLRTIEKAKELSNIPFCVFKPTGLASATLLEKVQSGRGLTPGEEEALNRVRDRIDRICAKGFEYNIPILVDAEDSWYQNPIDRIVLDMMLT